MNRLGLFLISVVLSSFDSEIAIAQGSYFQQRTDYDISVKLDDKKHFLNGSISINYTNNSSDTLSFIYFHLWPNAYKDRNTALSKQLVENGRKALYFAKADERGYIDSLDFKISDKECLIEYDPVNPDICKITPETPVVPGQTVIISTPFRVKIPSGKFSRFGHIEESYFISQWYPKPAVYDRNGWNQMPYLDQGEFYSEFGSFKVSITLPENYVVAASGILQEKSEIDWLNFKVQETENIVDFGKDNTIPVSASKFKTITFKQDSIHDFAWFADKRFHVLKGKVTLESGSKTIETWAYFTNLEPQLWKNSIRNINDAIRFYSSQIGDYPYAHYSAVDGTITAGGGMEYPMITVINKSENEFTLNNVLAHEIGHSWFYGVLANNERANGWMDEGINSYYELRYISDQYPGEMGKGKNDLAFKGFFGNISGVNSLTMKQGFEIGYKASAFDHKDQPVTTPSTEFTLLNYGTVMYAKTALSFDYLQGYLGDTLFKSCMQSYFQHWKYKHPEPDDIRKEFETVSGKNLNWFFDGILASNQPVPYKIKSAGFNKLGCELTLQNKGTLSAPFYVAGSDSVKKWFEGFSGKKKVTVSIPPSKTIFINDDYAAVLKSHGSQFRTEAIFKNSRKVKLKMFPNIAETEGEQYLYLMPVLAWNRYNSMMAGVNFSNIGFIPKPFEFSLTPLYDFKNNQIAGLGMVNYHVWPISGILSGVNFSVKGKRFAYDLNEAADEIDPLAIFIYSKIEPGVEFSFRKKVPRSKLQQSVFIRSINLWQDEVEYSYVNAEWQKDYITSYVNINELSYLLSNKRTIDPFSSLLKLEQGKKHLKLSGEFKYKFSYAKKDKGIDVRLFAGGFLLNYNDIRNYNFRMSGWEGSRDYLYDEIYFGRTDDHGFWDNQFMVRDGGFKIPTFVGQSNKWIASMNINADLPFPLPIRFFVDLGTYEGISTVFPELTNKVMFDGGLSVYIIKDVIEVYVPLFNSDDIEKNLEINNYKFFDKVRFVFNLNSLSPLHLRNQVYQLFE